MHIYIELCKRTDVNLELLFLWYELRQIVVKSVYSFYNNYLARIDFCFSFTIFLMSGHEIESRKINFFARQKVVHIAVEELYVNCIDALIIRLTVCVLRSLLSLNKVVVGSHIQWLQTHNPKLYAKSSCKGSLSGRRRARD